MCLLVVVPCIEMFYLSIGVGGNSKRQVGGAWPGDKRRGAGWCVCALRDRRGHYNTLRIIRNWTGRGGGGLAGQG